MSKRSRKMMADRLPTKGDFVTHGEDLDQACAWEHFGGLSLQEAELRFAANALYYQEDFMFMGTNAFLFYFPVLDHYLRNAPDIQNDDDYESWIISHCIRAQFESDRARKLRSLVPAVVSLANFVRDNIHRFGCDDLERTRVADAWAELVQYIEVIHPG